MPSTAALISTCRTVESGRISVTATNAKCRFFRLRNGRAFPAHPHQHDFRRDAETDRHDATAKAAGDDDVAACPGVGGSQPVSVTPPPPPRPTEQTPLAAMGMPRKLQGNSRR